MTDIRQAKIGDNVRWNRFGRWTFGTIHDVFPGGYVLDYDGKTIEMSVDKLINCQAHVMPRGRGE